MDNENVALYKETLFDKIFKPEIITLANGHTVRRRKSRTPWICLAVVLVILWALRMTEFELSVIIERFDKLLDLFLKLFRPNWEFFPKVIKPLLDTVKSCAPGVPRAVPRSVRLPLRIHDRYPRRGHHVLRLRAL